MKTFFCLIVLGGAGYLLEGCSDNPVSPISFPAASIVSADTLSSQAIKNHASTEPASQKTDNRGGKVKAETQ